MNVKLTKVSDNENKLRTKDVLGTCVQMPAVGMPFLMFAEGIEFGTRYVQTSIVQELTENGFKTLNSEYKLEVLPDAAVAQG